MSTTVSIVWVNGFESFKKFILTVKCTQLGRSKSSNFADRYRVQKLQNSHAGFEKIKYSIRLIQKTFCLCWLCEDIVFFKKNSILKKMLFCKNLARNIFFILFHFSMSYCLRSLLFYRVLLHTLAFLVKIQINCS